MNMFTRFWQDEAGFVVSSELVLVATILVIGMTTGLATIRNAVVQELGDVAGSLGNINQSFTYSGVTGHSSSTAGSFRADEDDFCDVPADVTVAEPACMDIDGIAATSEQ